MQQSHSMLPTLTHLTELLLKPLHQDSWYSPSCFFTVQAQQQKQFGFEVCSKTAKRKSSHSGGEKKFRLWKNVIWLSCHSIWESRTPSDSEIQRRCSLPLTTTALSVNFSTECPQTAQEATQPSNGSQIAFVRRVRQCI